MHGKLTKAPAEMLMKLDGRFRGRTECSWKVPLMHRKLMDRPSNAQKVDSSSWNVQRTYRKLMIGPMDAWKADGRSRDCTES